MNKLNQLWQSTLQRLPVTLAVLSWASLVISAVGIIATLIVYGTYSPQPGDETVAMNVGVTGVMVGLYFFAFGLFGTMILRGKTWGMSGLVLTHITLLFITITVVKSGQWWLATIFGVVSIVSLALIFSAPSMNWYKQRFVEHRS